jgi:hypothetical protein
LEPQQAAKEILTKRFGSWRLAEKIRELFSPLRFGLAGRD